MLVSKSLIKISVEAAFVILLRLLFLITYFFRFQSSYNKTKPYAAQLRNDIFFYSNPQIGDSGQGSGSGLKVPISGSDPIKFHLFYHC